MYSKLGAQGSLLSVKSAAARSRAFLRVVSHFSTMYTLEDYPNSFMAQALISLAPHHLLDLQAARVRYL